MTTHTRHREALEGALLAATSGFSHHSLMRYHLGMDGLVRPPEDRLMAGELCLAVADVLAIDRARAMPVAIAVVLLQSVIIAQADLRTGREDVGGRPSLARASGEPLAINTEDGFFSLAEVVLARLPETGVGMDLGLSCQRVFDTACTQISESQPHAALATPVEAGVACLGIVAGLSMAKIHGLSAYGKAIGSVADGVSAAGAVEDASRGLVGCGLDDPVRGRLMALATEFVGGSK